MTDFDTLFSNLAMSEEDVYALSGDERERRVDDLIAQAFDIYDYSIREYITNRNRSLKSTAVLFSGGNDSTFLLHLFRDVADVAIHIDTTIGLKETRQFVDETCELFNIPLIVESAPVPYSELVVEYGFPGPSLHYIMYQRLKERAVDAVRRRLLEFPRRELIVFVSGRRRTESHRRATVPYLSRDGAQVWCSPIANWTKPDIATYRARFDGFPVNLVSDLIHMSGECLCGAFAAKGEFEQLKFFFPEMAELIHQLEHEVAKNDKLPDYRKQWGWGSYAENHHVARRKRSQDVKVGPLCSDCEFRLDGYD